MFSRRDASNTSQTGREEPMPIGRMESSVSAPVTSAPSTPLAAPAPQASTAPAAAATPNESIIAQDDVLEGQLKTTSGVRVLGTVRGGIESDRSVRIEAGAHVEADISADEVVIAGTYSGNLNCRNRVEIQATGRVSGKLDTVKLHLHEGGFFDGELHMQRPPEEQTPRASEAESPRNRRGRYVDITSDTPKPVETANEVGKNGESST